MAVTPFKANHSFTLSERSGAIKAAQSGSGTMLNIQETSHDAKQWYPTLS
jgi:hypothetical protein